MTRTTRSLFFSALVYLGLIAQALAQQVDATLSEGVARVGQAVQLTISVSDGRGAEVPEQIHVQGLEIRFVQRSSRFEMTNGRTSSTTSYTYLVIPLQEGNFTIPAVVVNVGGRTFQTGPLKLQVNPGGGQAPPPRSAVPAPRAPGMSPPPSLYPNPTRPAPQQAPAADDKIAFGDLLIPKKTAYVGEVVPVEVRFYFDARYGVQMNEKPTFVGDGFTILRFSKPIERQQEIDGRIYNVIAFQTALIAAKTGKLEIPPAKIETQIQVPGSMPPGFENFFGGIFGNMVGADTRSGTLETQPATLEVKPLPKEGKPENFTGAIGQFGMTADVTPKKAAQGDPLSLKATITGQGNFEAMGAPSLTDEAGWRSYPPNAKFQPTASDVIGLNGEKRYEFMIVAREDRNATPGIDFSYFDPKQEKYVKISTKPLPVEAKGGAPAAASPTADTSVATPQPTPSAAAATPTPEPQREKLLADTFTPADFTPLVENKTFLILNGLAAVLWVAALIFCLIRSLSGSQMARQSASRRESRQTLKKLDDQDAATFFPLAAQFIRKRLNSAEAFTATQELIEMAAVPPETKAVLLEILERDEELKYSTHASRTPLDADDRRRFVENLRTFDHALPH